MENMGKNVLMLLWVGLLLSACGMENVKSQKRADGATTQAVSTETKQAVLLELFTSEGCASCPPADKALAFLQRMQPVTNAEIITLGFHVDYWNNLGWRDEFSSAQFTDRQDAYGRMFKLEQVFTPQMVVDGKTQFVGNDTTKAVSEILDSAKIAKAVVNLALDGNVLKVRITEIPDHRSANVLMAVTEDNLSNNVKRGENHGQKLEHSSVVRELKTIGSIKESDKTFEGGGDASIQNGWKRSNLKVVVFVQEEQGGRVIGAAQIKP
jgi:hypothetical protein